MRRARLAIGVMATVLLCTSAVPAYGGQQGTDDVAAKLTGVSGEADHDGYLVGIKEGGVSLFGQAEPDLEKVADGIYRADSLDEVGASLGAEQIAYIEPDYIVTLDETAYEQDPLSGGQWYLRHTAAPVAWYRQLSGTGVRVAVLDSGLRLTHEDLADSSILPGWNYVDDNDDLTDSSGHGTAAVGIIAAARGNGVGISGLVDGVSIVPLKVFQERQGLMSNIVAAVYDAVDDYDCQVINMSFSAPAVSRTLGRAAAYAEEAGVILVASVGNEGSSHMTYPAGYDTVIGVGALNEYGEWSTFSQFNDSVYVTAPGQRMRSLSANGDSDYISRSGTSFATPVVTAAAAMAKGHSPDMTPEEFRRLLRDTAKDLGDPGWDEYYGWGALDLDALSAALTGGEVIGKRDILDHWAVDSICYTIEEGILIGITDEEFGPDVDMTRAMFVTVLGRIYEAEHGEIRPLATSFTDLDRDAYYADYVSWACRNGIAKGYDEATFGPDDPITREQAAVMLHAYAQYAGDAVHMTQSNEALLSHYADADEVSDWAAEALEWALASSVVLGEPEEILAPEAEATRGEAATLLYRFCEEL